MDSPASSALQIASFQGRLTGLPFDGYLKYRTYEATLGDASLEGGFVHGPGHFVAAVAALAFDLEGKPHPIFKTGDTRLSRAERGEPYVLHGIVAGRLDKEGASAAKIVLAELAEEVGGEVVEGTFLPLGAAKVPTMPFESSEADVYHLAAVKITGKPYGDGGAMEVVDLIGPLMLTPDQARVAMDTGQVAEGGRARAMFARAYDALGYIPALDLYVGDHPCLAQRFTTLGLGPVLRFDGKTVGGEIPEPQPVGESLESRINHVVCETRDVCDLTSNQRLIAAMTRHAVKEGEQVTPLATSFPNQYLQIDYDRVKLGRYFLDPDRGPMLELTLQARPALAFAEPALPVARLDVEDLQVQRGRPVLEQIEAEGDLVELGLATSASSGQCDLYYSFVACQVTAPEDSSGFTSLSEAIRLCRRGHGDAHTEAFCQRLADHLGWIPGLRMTLDEARRLLESES